MTVKEVIGVICERKGLSTYELADRLQIDRSTVSHTLSRNDGMSMKIENFIKWLEELDYQVVIMPSYDDDDELILDGESEL